MSADQKYLINERLGNRDVVFSKSGELVIPIAAYLMYSIYCSMIKGGYCWNVIVFFLLLFVTSQKNKVYFLLHEHAWKMNRTKVFFLSDCLHLKVNLKRKFIFMLTLLPKGVQTKYLKFFWLKIFSICHRCQRHRWCILSCGYLGEFSKKFETALMGYSVFGEN